MVRGFLVLAAFSLWFLWLARSSGVLLPFAVGASMLYACYGVAVEHGWMKPDRLHWFDGCWASLYLFGWYGAVRWAALHNSFVLWFAVAWFGLKAMRVMKRQICDAEVTGAYVSRRTMERIDRAFDRWKKFTNQAHK